MEHKFLPTICSDCCEPIVFQNAGKFSRRETCLIKGCQTILDRDKPDYEKLVARLNAVYENSKPETGNRSA